MTLSPFYRRMLALAAVSLLLGVVIRLWPEDSAPSTAPTAETVAIDEQRLARLRDIAATVPAKEEILNAADASKMLSRPYREPWKLPET